MTLPIEVTERRLDAIKKLAERHHIIWDPDKMAESTMDEDTQLYFLPRTNEERKVPLEFAVVTSGGGGPSYCIYADYDSPAAAFKAALEHIEDSIFSETPHSVINLDTGARWEPEWDRVPWQRVN